MRIDALDFALPDSQIATEPMVPRDTSRLMVCDRATGNVQHQQVRDLPTLGVLDGSDGIIMNRTRVLPAAFPATREKTGGAMRGLYLRTVTAERDVPHGTVLWEVMLESRGRLEPGERVLLGDAGVLVLQARLGQGVWQAQLESTMETLALLTRIGETPLPPYIQKARRKRLQAAILPGDLEQYNTVFACDPGSVAAPTAGLHMTPTLLEKIQAMGVAMDHVTLNIGLGTFSPIRAATLEGHEMHHESYHVPRGTLQTMQRVRERGGRLLLVGTTTVRTLESLPDDWAAGEGDIAGRTNLFIHPGKDFTFRFTDMLMTNFHLPRSTLLAMVASLPGVGLDQLKAWYAEAIREGYRFYSFGDAMLIV